MKLIEIVVAMIVLMFIMIAGVGVFSMTKLRYIVYLDNLSTDSQKLSLYNYSKYLVTQISSGESAYISYSGNTFMTGLSGTYPYLCEYKTGVLMTDEIEYQGVFCEIGFNQEKIYNYRLFN